MIRGNSARAGSESTLSFKGLARLPGTRSTRASGTLYVLFYLLIWSASDLRARARLSAKPKTGIWRLAGFWSPKLRTWFRFQPKVSRSTWGRWLSDLA